MTALLLLVLAPLFAIDLNSVRNEPNPGRRSELAMENANAALDAAKDAYNAGDGRKMQAALDEVADSVDLAYDSLAGEAHRNTKAFKKAEKASRELLRRLEGLRELVDVDVRGQVDKVRDRVSVAHDNLLNGIMRKK